MEGSGREGWRRLKEKGNGGRWERRCMAAGGREKGRRQIEEKGNGNEGGWKRKKVPGGRERE